MSDAVEREVGGRAVSGKNVRRVSGVVWCGVVVRGEVQESRVALRPDCRWLVEAVSQAGLGFEVSRGMSAM